MFRLKVKDFDEGFFKLNRYLFFEDAYDLVRGGVTAHAFHTDIIFDSADCGLNMHEINYTINKWRMIVNLYLDPTELGVMCARLLHYRNQKKYKNYFPDIGMQFKSRRNVSGACLMSMTIGYNPVHGWHCEVFTRASETTMRWYVDLIFIHVLLREIGKVVGFTTSEIKVFWHMVSLYQSITSMPWFLIMVGQEDWLKNPPEDLTAWQEWTVKRFKKVFEGGAYGNFRVQRRPQEAYLMFKGEMERKAEVWTKDLTLPEIDINQQMEQAEEDDLFGAGGYR